MCVCAPRRAPAGSAPPGEPRDSLEVAGRADVGLGQLLLLAFGLLVLAAQAAVTQHVVEVVRLLVAVRVVEADVVDLRVLDVHRGHVESRTCEGRRSVSGAPP